MKLLTPITLQAAYPVVMTLTSPTLTLYIWWIIARHVRKIPQLKWREQIHLCSAFVSKRSFVVCHYYRSFMFYYPMIYDMCPTRVHITVFNIFLIRTLYWLWFINITLLKSNQDFTITLEVADQLVLLVLSHKVSLHYIN